MTVDVRSAPGVGALLSRCTFPTDRSRTVHVAVSGGSDSTALLVLATASRTPDRNAPTGGSGHVVAHHVDHQLRPQSDREAHHVERMADRLGAGFVAHTVVVEDGPNLEERCRQARLGVLPADCLFGHTMDDQAETVLLRIMRGTGPSGLAPMDPETHPILGLRRSETVSLCETLGIEVVADPTNSDPRFRRNRVRSELLPLLEDIGDRDPVPLLVRLSEHAGEIREGLEWAALGVDPTDARAVASVPSAVAHAVLVQWWRSETNGLPNPDYRAVDRMMLVARGEAARAEVCRGWRLERSHQRLRLTGPETRGNVEARE
jgi:tRNA(Ile)-lysidine synthase